MASNNGRRGCGCFGWIIVIVVVGFIVSLFINGSDDIVVDDTDMFTDGYYETTGYENETENEDENEDENGSEEETGNSYGDVYGKLYPQLNSRQQQAYNTLLEGVARGENKYDFYNISLQDFDKVFTAFGYDHPEFFWLSTRYSYISYSENHLSIELQPYSYWVYSMNHDKYISELNAEVDKIIAGARYCTTTYDKIKYVHDYISDNMEYDYDMLEDIDSTFRSVSTEQGLSIYGALVNGKAVCGGYSETFYYLMNKLGVDCHYIQGDAGGYHAWNCLEIDGEYYYMDVTWDDRDTIKDSEGNIINDNAVVYRYFCVTSEEFSRNHTPDSDFVVPYADSEDYDYFKRNGYYIEKYSFYEASRALAPQKNEDIVSLKFGSKYELDRAVDDLLNNDKLDEINGFERYENQTLWYNTDDSMYVLWVYLK